MSNLGSPPQSRAGGLSVSTGNGNNIPRAAPSPASIAGSDWSGISKYATDSMYGGGNRPGPRSPINVSPPSSIARSSDGTGLYASMEGRDTIKSIAQEEEVAAHHDALRRMLQPYLSQLGGARPNKARDKLLRLSPVQFQELSTDVYDELQRRSAGERASGAPSDHPPHLLPKEEFHPKRNQARQKLSTLPLVRFRDLATDVFYELERRFPKFNSGLINSPTNSMDGRGMPPPVRISSPGPNGMGPPGRVGSPGPQRRGSPGPGQMRNNGPPYGPGPNGPNGFRGPPRGPPPQRGPMSPGMGGSGMGMGPGGGPDSPNSLGRPLPKTFQNNMVIPNKSTMVEDDDDDDIDENELFGADKRSMGGAVGMGRRESARSLAGNEADKRLIAEYQSKVEILQEKVADLEASAEEKGQELNRLRQGAQDNAASDDRRNELEDLRLDLEGKLADAENLNNSLRSEIDRAKAENEASERVLYQQIRDLQERLGSQPAPSANNPQHEDLVRAHEDLKLELREQEEVTEEVRREAMGFLNQMKDISERADNSYEREQALQATITKLQAEVQEWKNRYTKAKTTIRSIRSSSMGLQVPSSGLLGKDGNLVDARGLIRAVALTKFQISIDELLRIARGMNFSQSLDAVKSVVVATRSLTAEITDENEEVARIKQRVSATANNLTTAAKNHAGGHGLSPVSLLDAAASHLTASVIELVRLVKIRPTSDGDIEEEDEYLASAVTQIDDDAMTFSAVNGIPKGGYFGGFPSPPSNGNPGHVYDEPGVRVSGESVFSGKSQTQRERSRNGNSMVGELVGNESRGWKEHEFAGRKGSEVEELRTFLETLTERIVISIQTLLTSIRSSSPPSTLTQHISTIASIVLQIVTATETAMALPSNTVLKERAQGVVANLEGCRGRMVELAAQGENVDDGGAEEKEFKSKLAGCAFELARETKELVRTVEEIDLDGRGGAGMGGADLS